jgi:alkylated DNA repair dioxygenase AlkB
MNDDNNIISPLPGLILIPNFITKEEEQYLIDEINNNEWDTSLTRLTQHYGYKYNYKSRNITEEDYLGPIPDWFDFFIEKTRLTKLIKQKPDQIIINRYLPGEGISAHTDIPSIFKNQIFTLSLGSGAIIEFKNKINDETKQMYLPRRTFLLMQDEARYNYTHEIKKNKIDDVNGKKKIRKTRYSITCRNVVVT